MKIHFSKKKRKVRSDILEIAYRDIVGGTALETLKRIYQHIDVPWEASTEQNFVGQMQALGEYRPNTHVSLAEPLKEVIRTRWGGYMDTFSYW